MDKEATGLRRIAGIGTATEHTLREAGVRTLADLADRPTDELAGIVGKPPRTVQEWQARARELAAGEEPGPTERDRQRSETFTVEVLLNESDTVRYVRAEHVYTQAGHVQEDRAETASWRDWRSTEQELAGFLEVHAGLAAHAPEPQPAAGEPGSRPAELQSRPKRADGASRQGGRRVGPCRASRSPTHGDAVTVWSRLGDAQREHAVHAPAPGRPGSARAGP